MVKVFEFRPTHSRLHPIDTCAQLAADSSCWSAGHATAGLDPRASTYPVRRHRDVKIYAHELGSNTTGLPLTAASLERSISVPRSPPRASVIPSLKARAARHRSGSTSISVRAFGPSWKNDGRLQRLPSSGGKHWMIVSPPCCPPTRVSTARSQFKRRPTAAKKHVALHVVRRCLTHHCKCVEAWAGVARRRDLRCFRSRGARRHQDVTGSRSVRHASAAYAY